MAKPTLLYCVTDKDVFDALISGRQQFNENALLDLARQRGIYYSSQEDRVALINSISALDFGFHEIAALQAEFERSGKGEKTRSFRLDTALTLEEIKKITEAYLVKADQEGDKAAVYPLGEAGFTVDVKYNELDLSRTRLRQSQRKEAKIEFRNVGGQTIVSLPASEKAQNVAQFLADTVRATKASQVKVLEVDLSEIKDATSRTEFFVRLMSAIPNFLPDDVTRIRVDSEGLMQETADTLSTDSGDAASVEASEMLGVVRAVALHGQSLLYSTEFQGLRERGFYITSIQWSAKRTVPPREIIEFDASFADPESGPAFKYSVRGLKTQRDGKYTKNFAAMPPDDKKKMLQELENASMCVFKQVKEDFLKQAAATIVVPESKG